MRKYYKYSVECADKSRVIKNKHGSGGKHLKTQPELVGFSPRCPTDILHYSIQINCKYKFQETRAKS